MLTYCVRRLLLALLLVWGVASGAFLLTRLAPGDATFQEGPILDPDRRQAERERLGLNRRKLKLSTDKFTPTRKRAQQLDLF